MKYSIIILLVFFCILNAIPDKTLKWTDPLGRKPLSYNSFLSNHSRLLKTGYPTYLSPKSDKRADGLLVLVIADYLQSPLATELNTFKADLENEGYTVQTIIWTGGDAEELRAQIASYLSSNLEGAILIGELPVAWYREDNEEFPIELFYTDLNGVWTDSNSDGIYDKHTGDVTPEIWTGRLWSANLTWGDEIQLLKDYFLKNHAYRTGDLKLPYKAILMIDDDWHDWAGPDAEEGMSYLYGASNLKVCKSGNNYNAARWKAELSEGYEWAMIMAHSCPWLHTFRANNTSYKGSVTNVEIFNLHPKAFFYNLFACSNVRFVENDCLGNWYIFGEEYGLVAVGAAKSGSMLEFQDFFAEIADNQPFGESFKNWAIKYNEESREWFYGNAILGDPTLVYKNNGKMGRYKCSTGSKAKHNFSWSEPVRITSHASSDANPVWGLTNEGKPMLIWESGREVRADLYYSILENGTWSSDNPVYLSEYWSVKPAIACKNGQNPALIWSQYNASNSSYDLATKTYTNRWSASASFIETARGYDLYPKALFDDNNDIHLVWVTYRKGTGSIAYKKRNGTSWGSMSFLTSANDICKNPFLFLHNNKPILCFINNNKVHIRVYNNDSWDSEEQIPFPANSRYKEPVGISLPSGKIMIIVKSLGTDGTELYAIEGLPHTWNQSYKITDNFLNPTDIDIVRDGEFVHLIFGRKMHGNEHFITTWTDGRGFSSPDTLILPYNGSCPKLFKENNRLFIAFHGEQDSNLDIYVISTESSGFKYRNTGKFMPECFIGMPFPNPSSVSVKIKYNDIKPDTPVNIYDISGRLVYSDKITGKTGIWEWSFKDKNNCSLSDGVYIIKFDNIIRKVVKSE
ncbi:MAG: T9SS type A sorting domain-containing protein [Candidatus Coatesbacteria bacterium]|nr:T9SS type A sorting domain-containing protein [Candidatus Coatesbacteria bacterium]